MCDCPAHRALVDCTCNCDHTGDRLTQWKARARELAAEVAYLRAGEDTTPRDEGRQLTAGQWIHAFNEASGEGRVTMAEIALDNARRASRCFEADHEGRLAWADFTATRGWWNWRLVQWWWYRQYKRADRRALQRETAEIRARAEQGGE